MAKSGKTFFFVVSQGFTSRYLLRSRVFLTLKEAGARMIILSPNSGEEYFVNDFTGDNVSHEPFRIGEYKNKNSKSVLFFTLARLYAFNSKYFNNFTHYWKNHYFSQRKNVAFSKKIFDWLLQASIEGLSRSSKFRKLFIYIESILTKRVHQDLFDLYQPDFLVTTSMGMLPYDRFIMQEAHRNGVKNIALVLSWDNLTTKGVAGAHVDYAVTWTEKMKSELVCLHEFPEENTFVGGVVQYEEYFRNEELWSRERLFSKLGLSFEKKTIFYCLESPTAYKWNPDVIEILASNILLKKIALDCQLVIRPHPIYYRVHEGKYVYENDLKLLKELEQKYDFIVFDYPESLSSSLSFDMPVSEIYKLGALLKYSDIVMCFYSSINIEASIFDTPLININLYHKKNLPNEVMAAHAHNKRVFDTGGVWSVNTEKELISAVNCYLDDPMVRHEGRVKIVTQETGPNKGHAAVEIGNYLASL